MCLAASHFATAQQRPGTQIVLLGTGTPRADPKRSGPATAILVNGKAYVVDAGTGIVRQAAAGYMRGIKELAPSNLETAFITHLHSDHTLGYPDLIFTTWIEGRRHKPLRVYGPAGLEAMTKHLMLAWQIDLEVRTKGLAQLDPTGLTVETHEVNPGMIYEDTGVRVTAFPVSHGDMQAYGYRFNATDRTVVISGDTIPSQTLINNCRRCDVLIHEAYLDGYTPPDSPNWKEYLGRYHTTTTQLAEIANKTQPALLIVYHVNNIPGSLASSRELSDEQFLSEIRRTYHGKVVIGKDLDVY